MLVKVDDCLKIDPEKVIAITTIPPVAPVDRHLWCIYVSGDKYFHTYSEQGVKELEEAIDRLGDPTVVPEPDKAPDLVKEDCHHGGKCHRKDFDCSKCGREISALRGRLQSNCIYGWKCEKETADCPNCEINKRICDAKNRGNVVFLSPEASPWVGEEQSPIVTEKWDKAVKEACDKASKDSKPITIKEIVELCARQEECKECPLCPGKNESDCYMREHFPDGYDMKELRKRLRGQ